MIQRKVWVSQLQLEDIMRRMDIYENNAKLNQKSKTEQTLKLYTSWQNNIA